MIGLFTNAWRLVAVLLIGLGAIVFWQAALADAAPRGNQAGVKLAQSNLKLVDGVRCGKVGRAWQPGRMVKGRFLLLKREIAQQQRRLRAARGKAKTRNRAKLRKLQRKLRLQTRACKQPHGAFGVGSRRLIRVGGITCAPARTGKYLPGRYKGGYFAPFIQLARNFQREARFEKNPRKKKRLLNQAAKFRRMQGQYGGLCSRRERRPDGPGRDRGTSLRFDFSGAVGLTLTKGANMLSHRARGVAGASSGAGQSNIDKIMPDGTIEDAVESGTAAASRILIGPDDAVYMQFSGGQCLLAKVDVETGVPECVDSSLSSIVQGIRPSANPAIQFDDSGAIYYAGFTNEGKSVLRRHKNGVSTDMIHDTVFIHDFLVTGNGTLFLAGETSGGSTFWTRRILPSGGVKEIMSSLAPFFAVFPDHNVYFGAWDTQLSGVARYDMAIDSLDPTMWISSKINDIERPAHYPAIDTCPETFCAVAGLPFKQTDSGAVFSASGDRLIRYYPVPDDIDTPLRSFSAIETVGDDVYVAGATGVPVERLLIKYDSLGGEVKEVIGPPNEIEIFRLNHSPELNRLYFDGLRFANNRYVIGYVDLSTGKVTIATDLDGELEDFQTFMKPR